MEAKGRRAMRMWMGVLAVALVALAGCGRSPATPGATATVAPTSTSTSPTTEPSTEPSTSTSEPTTTPTSPRPTTSPTTRTMLTGMPVYFVGASSGPGLKLYREFRTVPRIDGPISSTISAMTRLTPLDPDYFNPWRSASWVKVSDEAATLTVDISADAFRNTNVGSELASVAVQQLVYTALAAGEVTGNDAHSVVITVNGGRYDAWGAVHLEGRWQRAPMVEVQAQSWIVEPQEGATVRAGTVQFTGYGTSFEATFRWRVLGMDNRTNLSGTAMGGSMGTFGPVRFSAKLSPGLYLVELYTDDPSGSAEGDGPAVDTKQFTVR